MTSNLNLLFSECLPPGWAEVDLGSLRQDQSRTFNPTSAPEQRFELYSVPSHADRKPEIVASSSIGSNKQFVSGGDVLISKINPRLNRTWVVREPKGLPQIGSTEWIVFPQSHIVDSRLLAFILSDVRIRDYLSHNASGVGGSLTRVRPDVFDGIVFALPPLPEQHRIVAKIEALFSELDNAVESLTLARAQLKTYRKALLKHAFEGKLTADWRAANADKLETPEALLSRIRKEREARYARAFDAWQTAIAEWRAGGEVGRKPSKPSRPDALSASASSHGSGAPWPVFEVGDVLSVSSGQGLTSSEMTGGVHPVYGGNGIAGFHAEWFLSEPRLIIGRVGAKCGVTLGSSFKCNTHGRQGIGCCDGQTKQAPQQRGTWRDLRRA